MYEIVITKKEMVEKKGGQTWEIIKEELWKEADFSEESLHKRGTIDKTLNEGRIPTKKIWGYTPKIDTIEEAETEIYRQTVEKLNLVQVIQAINNIFGVNDM